MSLHLLTRYGLPRDVTPAPTPAGYRYHRLVTTANNSRSTINIAEMELRQSVGGANAATGGTATAGSELGTEGDFTASKAFDSDAGTFWSSVEVDTAPTASASSTFSASYDPSKAFDGDPDTFWSAATGVTSAWIRAQYSGLITFTSYSVRARHDANNGTPKDWTLEYSDDGSSWETAHTVTNETGWADGEQRAFSNPYAGAHEYWRLNITANNGRSTINIAEILFGAPWEDRTWLQYDMGVGNALSVAEYAVRARSDANNGTPKDWTLEGSNDLSSWTVLDTVSNETGWSNGEMRVYTV